MKVTNGTIWQAKQPLDRLCQQTLGIKVAYWLARIRREVGTQFSLIEELRVNLVRQYGTTDAKGNGAVTPDSPNWSQFKTDFEALMAETVEIPFDKVRVPAADGLAMSAADLLTLDEFIEVTGL